MPNLIPIPGDPIRMNRIPPPAVDGRVTSNPSELMMRAKEAASGMLRPGGDKMPMPMPNQTPIPIQPKPIEQISIDQLKSTPDYVTKFLIDLARSVLGLTDQASPRFQIPSPSQPSHGYNVAEAGPEVVTAPGAYFPETSGEVIPMEGRQEGGRVEPPVNIPQRRSWLDRIVSYLPFPIPGAAENVRQSKERVEGDFNKFENSFDTIPMESRQDGGEVEPTGMAAYEAISRRRRGLPAMGMVKGYEESGARIGGPPTGMAEFEESAARMKLPSPTSPWGFKEDTSSPVFRSDQLRDYMTAPGFKENRSSPMFRSDQLKAYQSRFPQYWQGRLPSPGTVDMEEGEEGKFGIPMFSREDGGEVEPSIWDQIKKNIELASGWGGTRKETTEPITMPPSKGPLVAPGGLGGYLAEKGWGGRMPGEVKAASFGKGSTGIPGEGTLPTPTPGPGGGTWTAEGGFIPPPYTGPRPLRTRTTAVPEIAPPSPIPKGTEEWTQYGLPEEGIRYKLGPEDIAGDIAARARITAENIPSRERGYYETRPGGERVYRPEGYRGYYEAHPEERYMDEMLQRLPTPRTPEERKTREALYGTVYPHVLGSLPGSPKSQEELAKAYYYRTMPETKEEIARITAEERKKPSAIGALNYYDPRTGQIHALETPKTTGQEAQEKLFQSLEAQSWTQDDMGRRVFDKEGFHERIRNAVNYNMLPKEFLGLIPPERTIRLYRKGKAGPEAFDIPISKIEEVRRNYPDLKEKP